MVISKGFRNANECQNQNVQREQKRICILTSSKGPLSLTEPYWAILGLTGPYWALLGLTGPCWDLPGLTGPYLALISLGPY